MTITVSPTRIRGCSEVVFDLFRTGFLQHGLDADSKPETLSVCGVQMYCPRHCVVYKTISYYTPIVWESQSLKIFIAISEPLSCFDFCF